MRLYSNAKKNSNIDFGTEYEEKILSILINADFELQNKILTSLSANMFENYIHSSIFECAHKLMNDGKEINKYSICESLPKYVFETGLICVSDALRANYSFYIKKIKERYFEKLVKNAKTLRDIDIINEERSKYSDDEISVIPIHHNAVEIMENAYNNSKRVLTGYNCIDNFVGAMQGGDMVILAGAPSMGKTCTALNFMMNMSKAGNEVLLFSLEMNRVQLINRIACMESIIECDKFRKKELNDYEWKAYKKFLEEKLPQINIDIPDRYNLKLDEIIRLIKKSDCDIIVIDYMGLIVASGTNSYEKISEISRKLKLTALEVNKPLLVLHQLSRKYDDREDKMPRLSDLRDSGKIEQDADMVCFVYRPAVYKPSEYDENDMRYIVGKNRNGKSNKVIELRANLTYQKITEKVYA